MGNIHKTLLSSPQSSPSSSDAMHNSVDERDREQKSRIVKEDRKYDIDSINKNDLLSITSGRKRPRPEDFIKSEVRAPKHPGSQVNYDQIAREAMERIRSTKLCSDAFDSAKRRNVPEVFVDTKEKGKRSITLGIDVVSDRIAERSLADFGHLPRPLSSWGRTFLVLPWLDKIEVLDQFSSILANNGSIHFFNKVALIGDFDPKSIPSDIEVYSAPARLDLMFRFGVLKCKQNSEIAQQMKALIPTDKMQDAYSFALQSAVYFNHTSMIRYCFDNGASPLSPEERYVDYRDFSPVEIAFVAGTPETQNLVISQINKDRDFSDLKQLFFDPHRWQTIPKKISELIKKLGES